MPETSKNFIVLTRQILRLGQEGLATSTFLRRLSGLLLNISASDALQLWLMDPEGVPYLWEAEQDDVGEVSFQHTWHVQKVKAQSSSILNDKDSIKQEICRACSFPKISRVEYRSMLRLIFELAGQIGVLVLLHKQPNYFSQVDVEIYAEVANSIGEAICHRRDQVALHERIKELTCIYQIDEIVARPDKTVEENLQSIACLLPGAWQYPEITTARICFDGRYFYTYGFKEGKYRQAAAIVVHGIDRGVVEIFYTEERAWFGRHPFLKEEEKLLQTVAERLSLIIERFQARQEKNRLQEQLRHADRLATIGQLAAGVAHELNEPLSNILGFAQLAKKCPNLSPQALQDLSKIEKASLFAREVVKKLLIFARGMPSQKKRVNLNQIVQAGFYFETRCARQGICLDYRLDPDLPDIIADPGQITQVLVNLAVNALQAMPQGGTLTIETAVNDGEVALIVADTGTGMTDAVKSRIFIPFFTTKEIDQGTGLGLAVVHGIVSAHSGKIAVVSQVEKGSRFVINFPSLGAGKK